MRGYSRSVRRLALGLTVAALSLLVMGVLPVLPPGRAAPSDPLAGTVAPPPTVAAMPRTSAPTPNHSITGIPSRLAAAAGLVHPAVSDQWVDITSLNATHPPPVEGAAAVYDPQDSSIILFGGLGASGATNYTWIFRDWLWTNVTSDFKEAPPARYYASIAYDALTDVVVLFGGFSAGNSPLSDTWYFWPTTGWSPYLTVFGSPVPGPSARGGAAMAYDPDNGSIILFGGTNTYVYYNDTWCWNGTAWIQLTPGPSPPGREWATLTWDADDEYLVLTGGTSSLTSAYNDTWYYWSSLWWNEPESPAPEARELAAATWDPQIGSVLLFGGQNPESPCTNLGDTWNYSAGYWNADLVAGPSPRYGAAMAYDSLNGFAVLFGGNAGNCAGEGVNDTWIYGPLTSSGPFKPLSLSAVPNVTLGPAPLAVAVLAVAVGGIGPYSFVFRWGDGTNSSYIASAGLATADHTFQMTGNFVVQILVDDDIGEWVSVTINFSVGSVMVVDWIPPRDTYQFHNYGSYWSGGGNCYGVSSSEILYWQHDILGWPTYPLLPTAASQTSALGDPILSEYELNATTLAIMAHQVFDPGNYLTSFSSGQFASTWAAILGALKSGQVAIMGLGPNALHAVVVYGEQTFANGTIEMDISDPNNPLQTSHAWYKPFIQNFTYIFGPTWHGFTLTSAGVDPSPLQADWFFPLPIVSSFSWTDFPPLSLGDVFVVADTPIEVVETSGVDFFGSPGDSQSFVGGIPYSIGISEQSVELFRLPYNYSQEPRIIDPASGSSGVQLWQTNGTGPTMTADAYTISVNSSTPHAYNLTLTHGGFTLQVGDAAVSATFGILRMVGNTTTELGASGLDFPAGSTVNLTVTDWETLSSTTSPSAVVTITPAGGVPGPGYPIENGQVGLVPAPSPVPPTASSSPPFYLSGTFWGGVGLGGVIVALIAAVVIIRGRKPPAAKSPP